MAKDNNSRSNSEDLKRRPKKGSHFAGDVYKTSRNKNVEYTDISSNSDSSNEIYSSTGGNGIDLNSMSRKARKKKVSVPLIVTNVFLSLLLVFSTVVFCGTTYLGKSLADRDKIDTHEQDDFENIMVSTDENVAYFLVCGVDLSENLTDIIMVVCYDLKAKKVNILQIPRDTFIGTDVPTGKVNAVYGHPRTGESKIKCLMRRINTEFGLPLDYYITVTIKGTEKIIDAMGGVDINLKRSYTLIDDTTSPQTKKYFETGKQHLSGQWATALIRHRSSYDQGDMGRIKAQRSVYAAIMKKMINIDAVQMFNIVKDCMNDVSTNLTVGQALGYAKEARSLSLKKVKVMSIPGQSGYYNPTGAQTLSYYSVHKDKFVQMLNLYFLPYRNTPITAEDIEVRELHSSYEEGYDGFLEGGSLDTFDNDNE